MTRAQLDPNLKQAVTVGTPVEVFDPSTNEVYYLISAEQFQKLAVALADDFDPRQSYPLIDHVMAADDALDPLLESYQSCNWGRPKNNFPELINIGQCGVIPIG